MCSVAGEYMHLMERKTKDNGWNFEYVLSLSCSLLVFHDELSEICRHIYHPPVVNYDLDLCEL